MPKLHIYYEGNKKNCFDIMQMVGPLFDLRIVRRFKYHSGHLVVWVPDTSLVRKVRKELSK